MERFSDRYGYTEPRRVFIKECLPKQVENCICTCIDDLNHNCCSFCGKNVYECLQEYLWVHYFYRRKNDFHLERNKNILILHITCSAIKWYEKLNLLEYTLGVLKAKSSVRKDFYTVFDLFVKDINNYFKELNYAYRVVDAKIVEITSEEEIVSIEHALTNSKDNIRTHLESALSLYARKPHGDYRNSIKESISAVEAFCREKTDKNTLGDALKHLESSGIVIPKMLKNSFEKLYAYTNQPENGIRHALMEDDDKYVPGPEEALFMLVSCSSFLNYLRKKELLK